jgi:hypothetical protein
LASLPKSAVSELSERLRGLKVQQMVDEAFPENPESEMTKREENVLKVFTTGDSSRMMFSDLFFLRIGYTIITLILPVIAILF